MIDINNLEQYDDSYLEEQFEELSKEYKKNKKVFTKRKSRNNQ